MLPRAIKRLIMPAHYAAMCCVWPVERVVAARRASPEHPPVFIMGPPRSGTTLAYEAIVERYHFAYIANAAHRFYLIPALATRFGASKMKTWTGNYESTYGHIDGAWAPNEGGWVWNRWFPEEGYLDERAAERVPAARIRRVVAGIEAAAGAPFINKNVMHSVKMRFLDAIFPGCLFIHVVREPAANVRSILKAMHETTGPFAKDGWWSVRPRGWERVANESDIAKACAQVALVHRDIETDAQVLGSERRLVLDHAKMCAQPAEQLEAVGAFLSSRGVPVRVKGQAPQPFKERSKRLDDESERQIERWLSECAGA